MAHGDLTGRTKATLEKNVAQEKEAKQKSLSMATAVAEAAKDEVVDVKPTPKVEAKPAGDELVVLSVDESEAQIKFRVNSTIEQVTIGHGNHYDFEQGRTYRAPKHVYDHLEEKGLIWH